MSAYISGNGFEHTSTKKEVFSIDDSIVKLLDSEYLKDKGFSTTPRVYDILNDCGITTIHRFNIIWRISWIKSLITEKVKNDYCDEFEILAQLSHEIRFLIQNIDSPIQWKYSNKTFYKLNRKKYITDGESLEVKFRNIEGFCKFIKGCLKARMDAESNMGAEYHFETLKEELFHIVGEIDPTKGFSDFNTNILKRIERLSKTDSK